jgi:hypothetical protein
MYLVYKNVNDNMKLHYGLLLTTLANINEFTLYVNVSPRGDLKNKKLDYKKLHIDSVSLEYAVSICKTERIIKDTLPEYFL